MPLSHGSIVELSTKSVTSIAQMKLLLNFLPSVLEYRQASAVMYGKLISV